MCFAYLSCGTVFAQQAANDPALERELQRQLEERRQAINEFKPRAGAPDPGPAQARSGPCFDVGSIRVTGTSILEPAELAAIIDKYVPGCLQGADIQAVMRDIDGAYAERGHITTKTYIPPQNIASGTLELAVLEGRTEGLFLVDQDGLNETGRSRAQLATAFPGVRDRVFQLRDFEQGLDQMNRLRSVEAKLRLQPGEEPGGSNVIVQRIQDDRIRGYVTYDNQGSESTGVNQLTLDFEGDDILGLNDAWGLGLASTENTNALDFYGSIPYGYLTFNLGATYSEYLTPLTPLAELFGTSKSANISVDWLAHRDQTTSTTLSAGLQVRRSDRYINDARLTPQNLTTLSFGARHIRQNGQVRNAYDASLLLGLNALDADDDASGIGSDVPRAQYAKLEGGWYRQGPLQFGDTYLGALVTDLRLQYAPHALYSAEQMSIGSYSTIRGYEASEAVGDIGAYMRTDLYLDTGLFAPLNPSDGPIPFVKDLRPQVFADFGMVYDHARSETGNAASVGFGVSYNKGRLSGSALVAVPLIDDNSFEVGDPVVWLRLQVKAF